MGWHAGPTFWWATVFGAPPVAWWCAANGYGIAVVSPLRDLALLTLWATAEEVVFRGGIQPALARWQSIALRRDGAPRGCRFGVSLPNLITSVAFAAAHLWNRPLLLGLGVFPVSLLLGASLERSGRLAAPVVLHVYFNLLLYAASWLRTA